MHTDPAKHTHANGHTTMPALVRHLHSHIAHTDIYSNTFTCSCLHANMLSHTCPHSHMLTFTVIQTYLCSCSHSYKHVDTHPQAHRHTHVYTQSRPALFFLFPWGRPFPSPIYSPRDPKGPTIIQMARVPLITITWPQPRVSLSLSILAG